MRKQGTITRWDDDRGFGFISWQGDDGSVFVHIKAFSGSSRRPEVGDAVFYEIGKGKDGRSQAENVRYADEPEPPKPLTGRRQSGAWPVMFACLFVCFLVASAFFHRISWLVVGVYGVISMATFFVYGWDKLSAKLGRWRTPESTLHLMGLLGGWPGGLAAQRLLRHKSSKQEFLTRFWVTVMLNIAVVGYLVWSGEAGIIHQAVDKMWQWITGQSP